MCEAIHVIPLEAEVEALYPQIPQNESESSFTSYPALILALRLLYQLNDPHAAS